MIKYNVYIKGAAPWQIVFVLCIIYCLKSAYSDYIAKFLVFLVVVFCLFLLLFYSFNHRVHLFVFAVDYPVNKFSFMLG